MTPVVYRLLRGYLLRSVWLYAIVGLAQFLLSEFYWTKSSARISAPVALLGLWGVAAAINVYNLVWRSLPLSTRDAGVFRWWTMAGAPGIWMTLCDLMAWASQRSSRGLPAPTMASLAENILVGWAAVGVVAALPSFRRIIRSRSAIRIATPLLVAYASWLIYGIPTYSAIPAVSVAFTVAGIALLIFSSVEAARGKLWRWPDIPINRSGGQRRRDWAIRPRFGVNAIVIPLLKETLAFAFIATAGVALLYWLFPRAGVWLFWSYFIGISIAGFLLTYQVRSAIQILRMLPLSTKQLAMRLQFFGALPGLATLILTLLVNRALLHVKLDSVEFASFALIIVASQALPLAEPATRRISAAVWKWLTLLQRLSVPFYLGVVVLNDGGAFARWWWFRWPLLAAGIVLCFVGYYTLVRQLRSGIRPASNEGAFSAR